MKRLTVWFDLASPGTEAWFTQWPQAIEGQGVAIDWQPVRPADPTPALLAEPWLRLLWACAPAGRTPSRWLCGQALAHWRSPAQDTLGWVPSRDPAGPEVMMDLSAATNAARVLGITELPAVSAGGEHFDGLPGLARFATWLRESP